YSAYDFYYSIRATAKGDKLELEVVLPKALPKILEGKAGLNLEFLPATYFETTYLADERTGIFSTYPGGPKEQNDKIAPLPLAEGKQITLAPADPGKRVSIESHKGKLALYDGRNKAQNGWFVLR